MTDATHDDMTPPSAIRASDARELIEAISSDLQKEMRLLIDTLDISPTYRAGMHEALDRSETKAASMIDRGLSPPGA